MLDERAARKPSRRAFGHACAAAVAGVLLAPESAGTAVMPADHAFRLRGVYFHDGFSVTPEHHAPLHWGREEWLRQIRWLHACGINAVEFATMLEFNRFPQTAREWEIIENRLQVLELAHGLGLEFGYILTNTVRSTVPNGETPGNQQQNRAIQLCPQIPANFERTLKLQQWYMETFREADFFDEFAADWGGCHCGMCGVPDYLRYVARLAGALQVVNPQSRMYANTWCIAYWGPSPEAQGWEQVFDREISGSREVIAALDGLPDHVHLALPCHHLYRPLVYQTKGGKALTPVFPEAQDLTRVRALGRRVLAWPHFVMDDDPSRAEAWGIVHSEVRYLRQLLRRLRAAGIEEVMGNLYLPYLQISNTYAYGRLLKNPDLAEMEVLGDFARLVAHPDDAEALLAVMAWLENHSWWHQQMPEDGRLPALPCELDRAQAMRLAGRIRPNSSPELPLPYAPEAWLGDLRRSIERMVWAV